MASSIPIVDDFLLKFENAQLYGCESPKFIQFLITGNFNWSKEQLKEHEKFSEHLGVSYDTGLEYKWILSRWNEDADIFKSRIYELLNDASALKLNKNMLFISACVFLWSKNIINDPILDDLAKFALANQIVSDMCFTLNQKHLLEEKNKKPRNAPNKKDEVYFNTLMVFLSEGDKSKAAKKLNVHRKTISYHLEKVVGEYHTNLKAHPQLAQIKKAYDLWQSKKNYNAQ